MATQTVPLAHLFSPHGVYLAFNDYSADQSKLFLSIDIVGKIEGIWNRVKDTINTVRVVEVICEHKCTPSFFESIYAIATENTPLVKKLTAQEKQDPHILEKIKDALFYFYPSKAETIFRSALKQFSDMDLNDAYAILNQTTETLTYAQELARKKIINSIYHEELDGWERHLKNSPQGLSNAAKHVDSDNPVIRAAALQAQTKLKAYQKAFAAPLSACGADALPAELHPYLTGAMSLLSYYGVIPDVTPKKDTPLFCCIPVLQGTCDTEKGLHVPQAAGFPLNFQNCKTPQDLESEIRKQIFDAQGIKERSDGENTFYDKSRNLFFFTQDNFLIPKRLIPLPKKDLSQKIENDDSTDTDSTTTDAEQSSTDLDSNSPEKQQNLIIPLGKSNSEIPKLTFTTDDSETNASPIQNDLYEKSKKLKRSIYFSSEAEAQKWFACNHSPLAFKKIKKSPWGLHHASQHLREIHTNPNIYLAAMKAHEILEAHKRAVDAALDLCGAKKDHEGLKERMRGPLDYYAALKGAVPVPHAKDPDFHFEFVPGAINSIVNELGKHISMGYQLGYRLENPGPYALERELNTDIESITDGKFDMKKLPPITVSKELTFPLTEELKLLHQELHPKIRLWSLLNQDAQKALIQRLLQYNKWDTYPIQPEDVSLNFSKDEKQQIPLTEFIEGKLLIKKEAKPENGAMCLVKHYTYRIDFQPYTFILRIFSGKQRNPDTLSSHQTLQGVYNE